MKNCIHEHPKHLDQRPLRQYRRPWPASAAGDSFAERTDFWRQYSLLLVEKFIGGVVDTGEQFIGGVVDTGEQFFPGVVHTGKK
jgi:hypothetical protein